MSSFLDTSVLIRYLTGEPPEAAAVSRRILDEEDDLVLTDAAIAEVAWVLQSTYGIEREAIIDALTAVLGKVNLRISGTETAFAMHALQLCRPSNRISIVDALIWAAARSTPGSAVYSFDRRFPGEGLTILRS